MKKLLSLISSIWNNLLSMFLGKRDDHNFRFKYLASNSRDPTTGFLDAVTAKDRNTSYRFVSEDLVLVKQSTELSEKLKALCFIEIISTDRIVQNKLSSTATLPATRLYNQDYNIDLIIVNEAAWETITLCVNITAVLGLKTNDPHAVDKFCKLFETIYSGVKHDY